MQPLPPVIDYACPRRQKRDVALATSPVIVMLLAVPGFILAMGRIALHYRYLANASSAWMIGFTFGLALSMSLFSLPVSLLLYLRPSNFTRANIYILLNLSINGAVLLLLISSAGHRLRW